MRDRDDADARLAILCVEEALDIQRIASRPGVEPGRGDQIVERHRKLQPILGRIKSLQIEDADLVERRFLNGLNDAGKLEVLSFGPALRKYGGEQNMLTALQRIRVDSN